VRLVEALPKKEFAAQHLPGAIHLPLPQDRCGGQILGYPSFSHCSEDSLLGPASKRERSAVTLGQARQRLDGDNFRHLSELPCGRYDLLAGP
jgi:hypothetical protein